MSSHSTPSPLGLSASATFAAGTLVGGRFLVERDHATDALGHVMLARDQKTSKPIALRVLAPHIAASSAVLEAVKAGVRNAAKLKHRSILATYGIGTHDGRSFVASEWVQGSSLAEQLAQRGAGGAPFSVRGSYNVVAHLCKALAEAHALLVHGALRPELIWVTRAGRVKVGEFGLCEAVAAGNGWHHLDPVSQACLAPELRAGGRPSIASDVYGVGALLQLMLTGAPPSQPPLPPTSVHPDAPAELDAIVARCLALDPSQRFAGVDAIAQALLPLVADTPEPDSQEFGVDLEIDVDIATSLAPPAPRASALRSAPNPLAVNRLAPNALPLNPLAPPPAMRRPDGSEPQRPDPASARSAVAPAPQRLTPDPLNTRPVAPAPAATPAKPKVSLEHELSTLMSKLTEDDAPRWMAVKDGLDHGPFTARELIKLIVDGEVREQHGLLNMSTGERKPLAEWRELAPFVEQFRVRKAEADHAVALQKSKRIERGSNAAKFLILGGSIALLLIAGGGYLMSRQAAKKREAQNLDLAAMYESGKVKISGTAGILRAPARRTGGGGAKRSGGGDSTGFNSYDDAMNQAMELGDATKGGGERQLRVADIQAVMDRKLNSLFGCVSQELRSGGRLGSVQIDLAILGSGQVMGASVSSGSAGFKKCIVGKVRQIGFPQFPAPRMGARYAFDVN
jgi:eukaryotic-like serine/threonine-protein kinase